MHEKSKQQLMIETIVVGISIVLMSMAFILQVTILNETHPVVISIFGLSFLLGGYFKAKEGILETIEHKALNVEILMILAALSAFLIGNPSEGALLIMIFAISGILEGYANSKSTRALTDLLKLTPDQAILYEDGVERLVDIAHLKVGHQVIVKVGDSIPVDGKVLRGSSSVDEATITGESIPVLKEVNSQVYAGTMNVSSPLLVEITKNPDEFVVAKIIHLVNEAQANHGKQQTTIEKIEKWYVYFVILLALMFLILPSSFGWLTFNESIYRATVVLVVGSPCALMASIAPSMLSTLSNAARNGILIKGAYHLEDLSQMKVVVFDKTGTITLGKLKVVAFEIDHPYPKQDIMDVVYSMEKLSNHPLAAAITQYLEDKAQYHPTKVEEVPGHGMVLTLGGDIYKVGKFDFLHTHLLSPKLIETQAKGYSIVHIILNDQLIGYIALADQLRPGIKSMIDSLKKSHIKPILVTGDNEKTAYAIAGLAGIDEVYANTLPHQKKELVDHFKKTYGKVLMVGDGINDAPALASADIGASLSGATDLSIETADVIFMNNKLENIEKLISLARSNQTIIYQNIIFSVSIIFALLLSNVFGFIELPFGVIAHEGSTILVILNSLRMLIKK